MSPAYFHLLLNHLPIIGLAVAALALFLAILTRNRGAQIIAFVLIFLTSSSAWPVYLTGENAYKTIRGLVDDSGSDWLDIHLERAERGILFFAVPAVLSLLGIFLPRRFRKAGTLLLWTTLLSSAGCLGLALWIADAGGQIQHPEIRFAAPP